MKRNTRIQKQFTRGTTGKDSWMFFHIYVHNVLGMAGGGTGMIQTDSGERGVGEKFQFSSNLLIQCLPKDLFRLQDHWIVVRLDFNAPLCWLKLAY